jgi:hypothetical protein
METTDHNLTLKLKFLTETKRVAQLPQTFEELCVRVKTILYQMVGDNCPLPEFKLQYEDDLNGMISIEDNPDYKNAINHSLMLSLNKLIVYVKIEDEEGFQESVLQSSEAQSNFLEFGQKSENQDDEYVEIAHEEPKTIKQSDLMNLPSAESDDEPFPADEGLQQVEDLDKEEPTEGTFSFLGMVDPHEMESPE